MFNMTTFAPHSTTPKEAQGKVGKMDLVTFLNENWNLVVSMMLGIRNAVLSFRAHEDVTKEQFQTKFCFQLVHKRTKASAEKISEFFDYAPKVFFQIRRFYGIDNDDYLKSIGPEQIVV